MGKEGDLGVMGPTQAEGRVSMATGPFCFFFRGGSIVIVSSIAAYSPFPVRTPFSATFILSSILYLPFLQSP